MNLKKLKALLAKREARLAEIDRGIEAANDIKELKPLQQERNSVADEIAELRGMVVEAEAAEARAVAGAEGEGGDGSDGNDDLEEDGVAARTKAVNAAEARARSQQQRQYTPGRGFQPVAGGQPGALEDRTAKAREESEKRGKELKENRTVTVGASNVILPQHQATDIRPTFNEVSTLLDRVTIKPLSGGESFSQPYVAGYGTGDYKGEGEDYATAEPVFGYAQINKAKITAYAEDTEELQKLPAAAYDAEVMKGISIACRKKLTREILVGTGATNHLSGIFSATAAAIDSATDITITEIDEDTLDEIIFNYGGDEDVEDLAVLILNKKDLKSFAQLRDADGQKVHKITARGNVGDIDGVPYIINSACKAISNSGDAAGSYCMAYGPLSNYMVTIFSEMEVQRSTDYKFKQGMIAHKGVVFAGGNVVSKNGFLRIKK